LITREGAPQHVDAERFPAARGAAPENTVRAGGFLELLLATGTAEGTCHRAMVANGCAAGETFTLGRSGSGSVGSRQCIGWDEIGWW
jgi:hypothetical protein